MADALDQALREYDKAASTPASTPLRGYLGAFVNGAFTIAVNQDDSRVWTRFLDSTASIAKHHGLVPTTLSAANNNQWFPVEFYHDDQGYLSVRPDSQQQSGSISSQGIAPTTDINAFHKNVSGEIAALTRKSSPVSADKLLINDSADSDAPKYVEIGDLPSGGGGGNTSFYVDQGGTSVSNTTTETSLVGTAASGSMTIAANTIEQGSVLRLLIYLGLETAGSSPGTLALKVYVGATLLNTLTLTLPTSLSTFGLLDIELIVFDASTPSSSSASIGELLQLGANSSGAWGSNSLDVTADNTFDVKAKFSVASTSNVFNVEALYGMLIQP